MRNAVFLALFGAAGTLSRYGLYLLTYQTVGNGFPYATLLVNMMGSATFAFIMQVGLNTGFIPDSLRIAITVGFLGAFTTFSTFSYETLNFLEKGAWGPALFNIAANVVLCVVAAMIGVVLGKVVLRAA